MKLITIIALLFITTNLQSASRVNILPSNGAPCIPMVTNTVTRVMPTTYINLPRPSGATYYRPSASYSTYSTPRVRSVRTTSSTRQPMRTFTSKDGSTIKARLISISSKDKTAKIKTDKGRLYNVSIQRFSNNDVAYMKNWWANKNKR